jgi:hypothetical protein
MRQSYKKILIFILFIVVGWTFANTTNADKESTRIRIGLKLFRTILAADMHIGEKKDKSGDLPLVIIYKNNLSQASLYAKKLKNLGKGSSQGKIKKIPITIKILSSLQLQQLVDLKPAGIYLIEELDADRLQQLISYSIKHQIIIYSPFIGAVEQGVTAGLFIDARVKPYLNANTLKVSQLQLKSFFLKVSKHYEP